MINRYSIIGILVIVLALFLIPNIVENQDAKDYMVIQYPSGTLEVFTEQGPHAQWFGKVTLYPRQAQYNFCSFMSKEGGEVLCQDAEAPAKKLRFNDGGHANLSGQMLWEMPTDPKSIIEIHKRFGSAEAVQNRAVAKMIDNAVYLAGPLMSSTESSGSRRAELVQYINDQAENGVYVTRPEAVITKDHEGQERTEMVTTIALGTNGMPLRQ